MTRKARRPDREGYVRASRPPVGARREKLRARVLPASRTPPQRERGDSKMLSSRTVRLLLGGAAVAAYVAAAPGLAGATHRRPVGRAVAHTASVDSCLVGHWVSNPVKSLDGSGLAAMHLTILAKGKATLDLDNATPFVSVIGAQDSFVGTEVFKLVSVNKSFGIFPKKQHITETITIPGDAPIIKALSETFFDAANYRCAHNKLTTLFDLSQGGAWLSGYSATWKRG